MSIPLNNLYHWVEGNLPNPGCLYLFFPHGNKNILNLLSLHKYSSLEYMSLPVVVCHDQEPLNFDLYSNHSKEVIEHCNYDTDRGTKRFDNYNNFDDFKNLNLKIALPLTNIYDQYILLHSELNSPELKKYEKIGFVGCYYWSHALIALDWYRFAPMDSRLDLPKNIKHTFLIYNRDATGTRQYRIDLLRLLNQHELLPLCKTTRPKVNYEVTDEFLTQLVECQVDSSASADYNVDDFITTEISVVLETIFDDPRIQLTEKVLRPIACKHPFLLAAGSGSLKLLRHYGFKTFDPWINESYDNEPNSAVRLEMIVNEMKRISLLDNESKIKLLEECQKIASYNFKWFFSENFSDRIKDELIENLTLAYQQINQTRGKQFLSMKKHKPRSNTVKSSLLKLRKLRQKKV